MTEAVHIAVLGRLVRLIDSQFEQAGIDGQKIENVEDQPK